MWPDEWKRTLESAGVGFAAGLSDAELRTAEDAYDIRFPPDLEELLRFALPCGRGWPDWRNAADSNIERALQWPLEGILFDIENNDFWLKSWRERPPLLADQFAVARERIAESPRLIPIAGHRYLPQQPHAAGNPVFSVHQTDVIYYGSDLTEYFANEFSYYFRGPGAEHRISHPLRRIEFWSMLADCDYE
jgi:hypothetical protein